MLTRTRTTGRGSHGPIPADPVHLQSTGFVLDPDGNVVVSVYSTGAIGRLVPEDVAGLVNYFNSKQPA
jgi:hypothetical protein